MRNLTLAAFKCQNVFKIDCRALFFRSVFLFFWHAIRKQPSIKRERESESNEIDKTKFCLPHVGVVDAATVVVSHCVKLGKMWKMIFHFFLLLFVLICVLLKTICSILIEHAMKNKYYGKRGRKPHSHKWCCCHGRLSRHAVLVWCKNTAKDSHFCIKPHAKGEETSRADDKADIHKMIFWRARERKKEIWNGTWWRWCNSSIKYFAHKFIIPPK